MSNKTNSIKVRLDDELNNALQKQAEKEHRTISEIVRLAIVQYIETKKKED